MAHVPELLDLLQAGVHFGHKKSKRHPKMAPFIFGTRDDVSIINLELTQECLKKALAFAEQTARNGGTILFVGVKNQGRAVIEEAAKSCGMPYVNSRWLGGTLTNFAVISKMIKKYKKLKDLQEKGELAAKYTKKEQLEFSRDIDELEGMIGGISELTKLPDAVFILDLKKDKTSYLESFKKKIPIIAMCDSNTNPANVAYPIPANDDAIKSIQLIVSLMAKAVSEGVARRKLEQEKQIAQTAKEEVVPVKKEESK